MLGRGEGIEAVRALLDAPAVIAAGLHHVDPLEGPLADVGDEQPRRGRPATRTVAAERGYLRETGNLVFHLALLGLLISVALGQLLHYRGQAIITEGRGFANAVVDYDTFESGAWFSPSSLVPFSMTLDAFDSEFASDTVAFAQARDFTASVSITEPDGTSSPESIKVNHPLNVDGSKIYLQGNGFAPEITVHDADGEVAFAGRVPFLPEDQMYTSRGVVKVPDVSAGLEQIGLIGYFLPTAVVEEDGSARSVFPQPNNPLMVLEVYTGDLGLDEGVPQNVYELDTANLTAAADDDGTTVKVLVRPGETVDLPDGMGTVTLGDEVPRYVALDLRHDPSLAWVLTFSLLALAGLTVSLFTPRRRVWVRAWAEPAAGDGRTVTRVEIAGLARGDDAGLQREDADGRVAAERRVCERVPRADGRAGEKTACVGPSQRVLLLPLDRERPGGWRPARGSHADAEGTDTESSLRCSCSETGDAAGGRGSSPG
jgi:cytochrome c biogenesis protein